MITIICRFQEAGQACPAVKADCGVSEHLCVTWGAPYVHNDHVGEECHGGAPHAPCGQAPSDSNHRRLCPCTGPRGGSTTLERINRHKSTSITYSHSKETSHCGIVAEITFPSCSVLSRACCPVPSGKVCLRAHSPREV